LRTLLASTLPGSLRATVETQIGVLVGQGVPVELARAITELDVLGFASDIVLVSERAGVSIEDGAEAFFGVFADFGLGAVIEQAQAIQLSDRFERMALDRALANVMRAQRDLTADVLTSGNGPVAERFANWTSLQKTGLDRTRLAVAELTKGELTVSRLSVAAGLLADLAQEA
jgi:glutamate dehydrogenase